MIPEQERMDEMMWMAKKLLVLAVLLLSIPLLCIDARADKRICVLMSTGVDRYMETQKGVIDQLATDGFKEPSVKYIIENALGNKAKAARLAQKIKSEKPDLIVAIGTIAAVELAKAIKDTPIVFAMVYDPVAAGIARDWNSSGNNTTGVSPSVPMSLIFKTLKEFAQVKKLAVLYTPGEKNSETQLLDLQNNRPGSQLSIVPVILADRDDVSRKLPKVALEADAIYLTGSSIVDSTVPMILDIANKAKVITITHLEDIVERGALLGICSNSYIVGRLGGRKAGKILKGAKPSSIHIERLMQLAQMEVILNLKTAKRGAFQIPPDFMKKVTRTIE